MCKHLTRKCTLPTLTSVTRCRYIQIGYVVQIGYCGLDGEPEHGVMPGAPVNGPLTAEGSLDINVYCKGYVAWDCTAMFIQVSMLLHKALS